MKKFLIRTLTFVLILITIFSFFYIKSSFFKTSYTPSKSDKVLRNPLMGWAPNAEYTGYTQPHSLVHMNIYWKDIEPKKGVYNFRDLEKKFNFKHWQNKNTKFIIRLILDYPNENNEMTIPKWLYNEIKGDGTWYNIPYGKGFSPNYQNKTLIKYHEKLIEELGKRYNESNDIAFIQLGSIGHWGEWHTYDEGDLIIDFPNKSTCETYVSHYLKYFPKKILMSRRPLSIAKENNFGIFNDMLGDEESNEEFISWINDGHYNYLVNANEPDMKNFWKTAPSGGEFGGGNNGLHYLNNKSIKTTLNQIEQLHTTFIGPNCPTYSDDKYNKNFDTVLKTLGYRFTLKKITYNKILTTNKYLNLDIKLENNGVAPFYFDWPVKIILLDKDNNIVKEEYLEEDIRSWLPGEISINSKIKIDDSIKKGMYNVAIGIIDPATNKASIKFANNCKITGNYFKIANIIVK